MATRLWTVAQTADRLGLSAAEVEECLAAGELPHLGVGDRRLVPAAAVLGLVDDAMAGWNPDRVLDTVAMPIAELSAFCELLEVAEDLLAAYALMPDVPAVGPLAELVGHAARLAPILERLHVRYGDPGGA